MKTLEENAVKKKEEIPALTLDTMLVDTHCHLDMATYEQDLDTVLSRAEFCGVRHIITIGIDLDSSSRAVDLAKRHSNISAAIGIHPHDVDDVCASTYEAIAELADRYREHIVGYGEIGLDYFKQYGDPNLQRRHFANQLALARDLRLPVIIHDRDAHQDTLRILKENGSRDFGGVMHCFSGDLRLARQVLEFGLHISIPGIVTFKNATDLQEVAREVPIESLLLETDGPFLTPHPFRGKRNEPAHMLYTAACVAALRDISLDELAERTTANAQSLFGLPKLQKINRP